MRGPAATRSTRRTRQDGGLAAVAMPATWVDEASVAAASRNHCSLANSTWPNW